jgi:predicted transcriptional regulator
MQSTTLVSVRLPSATAKRLEALAKALDRSKSYLGTQAIDEFLATQEWQIAAIRQGILEADSGKLERHQSALRILKRWGWRRGH